MFSHLGDLKVPVVDQMGCSAENPLEPTTKRDPSKLIQAKFYGKGKVFPGLESGHPKTNTKKQRDKTVLILVLGE